MAYTAKDDFTLRIPLKYLDQILDQAFELSGFTSDQVLEDAVQTAFAEVGSYLAAGFIIEDEFAKDGSLPTDIRNKDLLKCILDIALFHVHYTISPRDIPETRQLAYDSCLEKLAAYRDGKLVFYPIFPSDGGIEIRPEADGGVLPLELVSHTKFISRPFNDPTGTE